jgi:poly(A) polymerase Pap1
MSIPICYAMTGNFNSFKIRPTQLVCGTHLLIHLGAKSLDLSWQVDDFKRICHSWEKYNPELSALHIDHIRRQAIYPILTSQEQTDLYFSVSNYPMMSSEKAKSSRHVH